MTTFVDYAWWSVSPAQLKAMGFSGAMRYCSHDGSKNLSITETVNLRAAGMDIGIVYESVANRAAQGSAAGETDAHFANNFADGLGYPSTASLWYAVDFDADPSLVQPYFDGIAHAGGRTFAPYGGYRVIEGVRYSGIGWQTVAWSAGKVSKRAGLLQNGFHNEYDSNQVLIADFGQWKAGSSPPQEEDDMPAFVVSTDGEAGQFLVGPDPILAIDDGETASAYISAGAKPIRVSHAHWQRVADNAK